MLTLTALEVLGWLKEYWRWLALGAAVLFCLLTVRGCSVNAGLRAELEACQKRPPVIQMQTVTVTAKARQEVKIIYQPGSPCPDIASVNDSEAGAFVAQSQTAQAGEASRELGPWSLSAGAAVYRGGLYGSLGGGYWVPTRLGDLGIEAAWLYPWAWEESQASRRPAGVLGLTIRP